MSADGITFSIVDVLVPVLAGNFGIRATVTTGGRWATTGQPARRRELREDRRSEVQLPKVPLVLLIAACLFAQPVPDLTDQVRRTEIAFAKTMADRDHAAFRSFLAEDVVFVAANRTLRGPAEVAAGWKRLYEGAQAPFSWEPEKVEVVGSGTLALSSGPVRDPSGKRIGTYNSVWRREPDGKWKIVIDYGCPPCDCDAR